MYETMVDLMNTYQSLDLDLKVYIGICAFSSVTSLYYMGKLVELGYNQRKRRKEKRTNTPIKIQKKSLDDQIELCDVVIPDYSSNLLTHRLIMNEK